jgi:hypothetical protein
MPQHAGTLKFHRRVTVAAWLSNKTLPPCAVKKVKCSRAYRRLERLNE